MGKRRATIALATLQLLIVLFVQFVPFAHGAAGAKAGQAKKAFCSCSAGGCCAAMTDMPQGCRCEGSCAADRHDSDPADGGAIAVLSCGCCAGDPMSPVAVPLIKWECIPPVLVLDSGGIHCSVARALFPGMRTAFLPEPPIPPPEG
jgi:hypothetical protein